jgi:predicted nucleic acid-binding protein
MIAYVDASVLLRVAFGEASRLREWEDIQLGVSSDLVRVECLRTIDRMRIRVPLDDDEIVQRRQALGAMLERMDLAAVSPPVLERASEPFPTALGTLDAIHLATALLWQRSEEQRLTFLTHGAELGRAARAMGFAVLGCA